MDVRHDPEPRARPAATRLPVSIVIPFAGDRVTAERVVATFAPLVLGPADEVVLADNTPAQVTATMALPPGWRAVPALGEASPARARNAGALAARADWLLFVDSDCRPAPGLVDAYFDPAPGPRCGLVAGRIDAAMADSVAGRYATSRDVLDQRAGLASEAGAWAHTANLLVRREVWRDLGGFLDGILNAEDVDFCWRAEQAGWTIDYNDRAVVAHEHRATVRGLWRQRIVQAASARWVHRRWPQRRPPRSDAASRFGRAVVAAPALLLTGRTERARMKVLDGALAVADVVGREASNRARPHPRAAAATPRRPLEVWCDAFPVVSETFVVNEVRHLQALGHPVVVVAARRPDVPALGVHDITVRYLEDDTRTERLRALAAVLLRHPRRCLADRMSHRRWVREEPVLPLRALAPAVRRLHGTRGARIHAHFAAGAALAAQRVSGLAGRPWSLTAHAYDIYLLPRNLREKVRSADVVTSGCDYTVRDLRRIAGPDRAARVHRIIMGVDPDQFRRTEPYPETRTVVAVGRLVEKKGFVHLVRAAAEPALSAVLDRLTIVGDGPLLDDLRGEVARLGLEDRVVFLGRCEADEVRAVLQDAAVLAMPCVVAVNGDRDSMPVVVKEALAMEIPVVVSDEVGLPELARPEFARVVPPGDHVALAAALADLLARPAAERAAMGREGRRFVGEHANVAIETLRLSGLLDGEG